MKAGLMEIADVYAVNKADRPGAENLALSIEGMLDRRRGKVEWRPPVVMTSASLDRGIDELYEALLGHRRHLEVGDRLQKRRKLHLGDELKELIETELLQALWRKIDGSVDLKKEVDHIWEERIDPQTAARRIVETWLKE